MTGTADDARRLMDQVRALVFSETHEGHPSTPPRHVETTDPAYPALPVRATLGAGRDGGHVIHVGHATLTPNGAAALREHLGELLDVIPGAPMLAHSGVQTVGDEGSVQVTSDGPGSLTIAGSVPGADVLVRVTTTGPGRGDDSGQHDRWNLPVITARKLARATRETVEAARRLITATD